MTYLKHIFYISTIGLLLTSCSNYGVISDNDVYSQKPAAIDLTDDEQDITSFNAYKAGRNGAFQRGDKRLENTNARAFATYNTRFMFGTYYNPFHAYYPTDPFIWGRPYYHFYGLNSPMFGMNTYYAPGFNSFYGYNGYGFMSPYYSHNYYGINYIGYGYSSGNTSYFGSGSTNQFYGPRNSLSGHSRRSSSYPQTLKNKMYSNFTPSNSNVNTKNIASRTVQNRREVSNDQREYVRPNATRNASRATINNGSNRNSTASTTNQRRSASTTNNYRSKDYTPSNTARRTGTVNRSSSQRSSGSYNSSNSSRRGSYSSGSGGSRGSYSSPQRSSSGSSVNRSSGSSSSRSSGSSSSRGGSSSSGRR